MSTALDQVGSLAYGAILRVSKFAAVLLATTSLVQAETVTIAALGDSLTAGYGLAQGDGFVPQLEGWLTVQGVDVTIMNAGVSGDTTAGGLSRAAWTLTPDVDAMIVALGGNDFLRGLDPAVSKANLDGILAAGQDAGVEMLLVGLAVGANYGPDYKREFESMYRDLAVKYGVPLYPDFASGLRAAAATQEGMSAFLQPDGLHPNPNGVSAIVADIGPTVLELVARVK